MADVTAEIQKNLENIGKIIKFAVIFIVVVFIVPSIFYTVKPEEIAVVQRFGKYNRKTGPGLHMKFPLAIEQVTNVPVARIQKEEFGYRTLQPGVRSEITKTGFTHESIMLTGDLNIADVHWVVQYKIEDPVKYLFNVRRIEETIRDMSEAVMRSVIGDRSIDEIITISSKEIQTKAQQRLQEILNRYQTGIDIVLVKLEDVNPPKEVKASFNEVNEAKQDKSRLKNEALQERNKRIPLAEGEKKKIISEAEGYAINRINRAKGDVARFTAILKEYTKAKKVTRKRMYLEKLFDIFYKVKKKIIVDSDLKSGILQHLNLKDSSQ